MKIEKSTSLKANQDDNITFKLAREKVGRPNTEQHNVGKNCEKSKYTQ